MGDGAEFSRDRLRAGIEASAAAAGHAGAVEQLERLAGGASKESWAFILRHGDQATALVARVAPAEARFSAAGVVPLATEAALQRAAQSQGVPVADIVFELTASGLDGYVMRRVEGESVGSRILRNERLAAARATLAEQCGQILARIHHVPRNGLPDLDLHTPDSAVSAIEDRFRSTGQCRPVFETALAWLRHHLPAAEDPVLLHGDFRNGNLMVGEDGVRAVLDWETAHLGSPGEDLGWLCVTSWRFGRPELPVGGFGTREALLRSYEQAGGRRVSLQELRFWEAYGTLRWGVMCAEVGARFAEGVRSVEGAMIARRASETEYDLVRLMQGHAHAE